MSVFRSSRHPLIRWWWELDRFSLSLILLLTFLGAIAVTTASVGAAPRYNVGAYYFAMKQYLFLTLAYVVLLSLTVLRPKGVERLGWLLLAVALVGVLLTPLLGDNVKGATRWLRLGGVSVQPSEFLKPALVLVTASLLAVPRELILRQFVLSAALLGLIVLALLRQPDVGMIILLGTVWGLQIFIAGVSLWVLLPLALLGLAGVAAAYLSFSHVRSRVERFLNPEGADTYQVDQAREAIMTGHLFGRGAGEGVVKSSLPDAHTDFIFAVIAEEFGIILCLFILLLYVLLVLQGFTRVWQVQQATDDPRQQQFTLLAVSGLLIVLALQVMVNIGVALHVLPTTGMTLPLISYGGSASLSTGLTLGFLLALQRRRGLRLR